jgi:hypothetical protein
MQNANLCGILDMQIASFNGLDLGQGNQVFAMHIESSEDINV